MSACRGALIVAIAVVLAGCVSPSRSLDGGPASPAASAPSTPPVSPAMPEPPRQADPLARVLSELVELQNAVAKLMMSARQHEDQLGYVQRRLTDIETQTRGRAQTVPGFAPSGSMPAPLPPPPTVPAPPPLLRAPSRSSAPVAPSASPSAALRPSPPPAASPMPSAAEELYQAGLAKYQAGDLDGAVVSLYEVVSSYPNDPARERAQFLIGEIFYAQKDYRGAVAELEGLVKAVPAGSRVPDALLKIGLAQRSLGNEARARRTWERLVKEYPASGSARQARTLLRSSRG